MKHAIWLVVFTAFAACAHSQELPRGCQNACTATVQARLGPRITSTRTEVCDRNNAAKCKQNVKMSVEEGKCVARFEYCVLCIVTKETNGGHTFYPTIEWTIDGPNKYRFVNPDGITIKNPTTSPPPKEHFKDRKWLANGRKFTWRAAAASSNSGDHDHAPVVFNNVTGEHCIPKDPVIVNAEN
ncbi:hypothetical protein HLB44_09600 [Aquincola sp. S2]|uniref:Uncharacterized protein n=1 Tax=Pseudaquabacterium terrae TaxID=2732868 RepID=A0ABX2EF47_9BURK|nr:hypothetical protein [Aquabacterium terrae]NRF67237.1 hypothetical protein [Aquabacterium terrae]